MNTLFRKTCPLSAVFLVARSPQGYEQASRPHTPFVDPRWIAGRFLAAGWKPLYAVRVKMKKHRDKWG